MQAAYYDRTGPAREVLQIADLPDPMPGPGELRVRLHWSGVNPSDVKSRLDLRGRGMPFARVVPHSDGMGVVEAVGAGVPAARVGQRVWVWNAAWGRPWGTAAQHVVLPATQAALLPEATPDEAGACLGIPALTALHGLLLGGGVAGERVLVAGGAGAVGHVAVQMARRLGAAQVLATASTPEKAEIARAAGAEVVVDYRAPDAAAQLREASGGGGVDRVLEVDIAANAALDVEVLRPGGMIALYGCASAGFTLPFFPLILKNIAVHAYIVYELAPADRARAEATLIAWLARGELEHRIAARLPLARIAEAHEIVEQGRAIGNVVLSLP